MDIQAIQAGLASAAATITGLNAYSSLPDSITPPVFGVIELDVDYNKSFSTGGLTQANFSCGVYASRGDSPTGRAKLVGYMAPTGAASIKAALESDRTLGGVARTLNVDRVRGAYRLYTIAGVDYLGAIFEVRLWGV